MATGDPAAGALSVKGSPDYMNIAREVLDPLIPSGATIALFDFPMHGNVGDSAIWLGTESYLRTRKDLQIGMVDTCNLRHRKLPPLSDSTVILLHGGGNLGDLWPQHQVFREKIISHYDRHRIIQMPQSIHFSSAENWHQCRRVFNAHQDFHLLVRDDVSFDYGHQLHEGPTVMCPDMALFLKHLPRTSEPQHAILRLLRTDKEAVPETNVASPTYDAVSIDWVHEPDSLAKRLTQRVDTLQARYPRRLAALYAIKPLLYHHLAKERLRRGCKILESGEVLITDRLHGHILGTLMEIPHVVLDNSYRKIGNFRDTWQTGTGLCQSANTMDEALHKARDMLRG